MIVFGNNFPFFTDSLTTHSSYPHIKGHLRIFSDGEQCVSLPSPFIFKGRNALIAQSLNDSFGDHFMELLLLAETLKGAECNSITALIPYMPYGRQDRLASPYTSLPLKVIGSMLKTCGIDSIITLDMHSPQGEDLVGMEVNNICPLSLFSPIIQADPHALIVAPDKGSHGRAKKCASAAQRPLMTLKKERDEGGACLITLDTVDFDISADIAGKNCFIIDDIVDTGSTLSAAACFLYERGASEVSACISHGLFLKNTDKKIAILKKAHLKKIYITYSIKQPPLPDFIEILPVHTVLTGHINAFFTL